MISSDVLGEIVFIFLDNRLEYCTHVSFHATRTIAG